MSRGNITKRGKNSWRIKFDVGTDASGKRLTRYVTVKGKRQDAQRELTRLLREADAGTLPEPSNMTVAEYLRGWLDGPNDLAPKTKERYRELAENQIIHQLGNKLMQRLKPAEIEQWHKTLVTSGAKKGGPLSARTVGHAHRVLHRVLEMALDSELVARNVAAVKSPSKVAKVKEEEVKILKADEISSVMDKLQGHRLYEIVLADLTTGLRRGELLALRLSDIDLEGATLRVERSLEETKAGLRFKEPKTKHGKRTLSLPPNVVRVLREHRRKLLEIRMALGLGKPDGDTLLFAEPDGAPTPPNRLTRRWQDACVSLDLPRVSFHALRHTHASLLIAAGLNVVKISQRLGHKNPTVTLKIYAHLFEKDDREAAAATEAFMTAKPGPFTV